MKEVLSYSGRRLALTPEPMATVAPQRMMGMEADMLSRATIILQGK